jgi:DNA-nicking Smr family endonuclease
MNRDGGGKPRSSRAGRQITEEEAELWHQVGRSLDKVKKKPRVTAHADSPAPASPGPERASGSAHRASPKASPPTPATRHPKPASSHPPPPQSSRPPAPAEIDRRLHRQVAVGKVPIDAVLDLHGLNQAAAHRRLRGFLLSCQARRHRMVLVVTGKGGPGRADAQFDDWCGDGSRRGVLRRSVPLWLEEPELRAIVVGYASAGVRHGGEGALYIRLRKAREA